MSGFFFNEYPYTDFHELNLSWLIKKMIELNETVKNFVSLNTIKYADPIQWSITTQYEANTVVIDPSNGNAYLSTQPVPVGVNIINTDYWTEIFNYGGQIDDLRKEIAEADEGSSTTASANRSAGDLVWINGELYQVTAPMIAGDSYVVGSNCEKATVETVIKKVSDDLDDEITARTDADTDLSDRIDAEAQTRADDDSALDTRITAVTTKVNNIGYVNVKDFGAVGDGVTDDTLSIQNAIDSVSNSGTWMTDIAGAIYFPSGIYKISSPLVVNSDLSEGSPRTTHSCIDIYGDNAGSSIIMGDGPSGTVSGFAIRGGSVHVHDLGIKECHIGVEFTGIAVYGNTLNDLIIYNCYYGIKGGVTFTSVFSQIECFNTHTGFRFEDFCTSLTFNSCYANGATNAGYEFLAGVVYTTFNSCASDACTFAYHFDGMSSVVLNGCGAEGVGSAGLFIENNVKITLNDFFYTASSHSLVTSNGTGSQMNINHLSVINCSSSQNFIRGASNDFLLVIDGIYQKLDFPQFNHLMPCSYHNTFSFKKTYTGPYTSPVTLFKVENIDNYATLHSGDITVRLGYYSGNPDRWGVYKVHLVNGAIDSYDTIQPAGAFTVTAVTISAGIISFTFSANPVTTGDPITIVCEVDTPLYLSAI